MRRRKVAAVQAVWGSLDSGGLSRRKPANGVARHRPRGQVHGTEARMPGAGRRRFTLLVLLAVAGLLSASMLAPAFGAPQAVSHGGVGDLRLTAYAAAVQ